ncbi:MAG: cobyrinic acid a,c-diamide synthase [Chlamydiae bacterium]|nr:cobyrinic acid a,c-diamide synthase [Chlamydiota bacterium]
MKKRSIFIAATGQNVGKTTCCLGLLAGLQKRIARVGFTKPVGQEHVIIDDKLAVDKDVLLFKSCFHLPFHIKTMSPIIFAREFTREYLDGKYDMDFFRQRILTSYEEIRSQSDAVLVEGTGHIGVGDIVGLNNAQVASLLGLKVIIIVPGGLGSSFDSLALNIAMCEKYGAEVAGVIINKVLPEKKQVVEHYMQKALSRWNIPILGVIPYDDFLTLPCMKDYEFLFGVPMLSGQKHRLRHFKKNRLVATSVEHYERLISKNQLIITPATRDDIISATLKRHWQQDLETGFILTGSSPPKISLVEEIVKAEIPMIYAPINSFNAMKKITSQQTKIRTDDIEKIKEAIAVVEKNLDFDAIEAIMDC